MSVLDSLGNTGVTSNDDLTTETTTMMSPPRSAGSPATDTYAVGSSASESDGATLPSSPAEHEVDGPDINRLHPLVRARLNRRYVHIVKPVSDRVIGILALAVCAVPFVTIAAMIRLTMGGPVLFRQERVGLGGVPFTVLKFRTMHHDRRRRSIPVAHDARQTHKSADDPRHTSVGRFLRKWGLDELPQIINVVRGEMSIVGPRPELVDVVANYSDPSAHDRHLVRPGLAGLWQISARGDGVMHENTNWDLYYLGCVSLRTDLSIVVRTPIAMLSGRTGE